MKALILYILLVCTCFLGSQQYAHAVIHSGKASHTYFQKLKTDKDQVIDIEDENDEDDISKKITPVTKWLTTLSKEFLHIITGNFSKYFSPVSHAYTSCNIYIVQRVLRI
jgi:hypothetical protein